MKKIRIITHFKNLRVEMARLGLGIKDLAEAAKISDKAIHNKLNCKTEFTLKEIRIIRDTFFKDLSLDYLFVDTEERERVIRFPIERR